MRLSIKLADILENFVFKYFVYVLLVIGGISLGVIDIFRIFEYLFILIVFRGKLFRILKIIIIYILLF